MCEISFTSEHKYKPPSVLSHWDLQNRSSDFKLIVLLILLKLSFPQRSVSHSLNSPSTPVYSFGSELFMCKRSDESVLCKINNICEFINQMAFPISIFDTSVVVLGPSQGDTIYRSCTPINSVFLVLSTFLPTFSCCRVHLLWWQSLSH